jgi:hypothetical protein
MGIAQFNVKTFNGEPGYDLAWEIEKVETICFEEGWELPEDRVGCIE